MGSRFTRLAVALLIFSCDSPKPWDGTFPEPVARPEHPRPDFRRNTFINLNTKWDFAYDPDDRGLREEWFKREDVWTHKIQVPFAWEAPLSGLVPPHEGPYTIFETLQAKTYRGVGWYRLKLPGRLPQTKGLNWHLIFGAVDFKSTVWINDKQATEHEGGYDPFSVNLADWAGPNDVPEIVLRVEDFTELNDYAQPVGKQGGVWYTRTSGIWQTVYLEQRPKFYLAGLRLNTYMGVQEVAIEPQFSGTPQGEFKLDSTEEPGSFNPGESTACCWWENPNPHVQEIAVRLTDERGTPDVVHTYFGKRDLHILRTQTETRMNAAYYHAPIESSVLAVNLYPRYLRCVLDQSYYPDGIYTAPSVDRIRADLELAKSFGFNCIRLHIKMDEPIKYRIADELGLYVVYDIPALDLQAENLPGFKGRDYFEHTLRAAIERDANHPSIIAWTIFNENWGLLSNGSLTNPVPMGDNPEIQKWVKDMVTLARSLDPTRPVEDNSAGGVTQRFEHIDTDLNSFHYYGNDMAKFREFLQTESDGTYPGSPRNFVGGAVQDGDPWWNSEFASFSALGGTEGPGIYCDLFGLLNEMRRFPKLVGYVLTQLTDVEYERNGLVNYDRSPKPDLCARFGVSLKDVLGEDFIAFDWLPNHELGAGATIHVPLRYSHWSGSTIEPRKVRLSWENAAPVEWTLASYAPYDATTVESPDFITPADPGDHTLIAEVFDAQGKRTCANRLTVTIR